MKGQVSLTVAVITAVATLLASVITSVSASSTKISVVEEREQNHYAEVQRQLTGVQNDLTDIKRALNVK